MPIPRKLAVAGVKDMVRISDARMSGTAFGTTVLHVSPEAAVGGPLSLVRNGDLIRLDVEEGLLELLIDESELVRRRSEWTPPSHTHVGRGYAKLYFDEVLQAEDGCDFNFLRAKPREVLSATNGRNCRDQRCSTNMDSSAAGGRSLSG